METIKSYAEITCDLCGKSSQHIQKCRACGKDMCDDCFQTGRAIRYYQHVRPDYLGLWNLYICRKCRDNPDDDLKELLKTFRVIVSLRAEQEVLTKQTREAQKGVVKSYKKWLKM